MEIISEASRSQTERGIECRNNVSIPDYVDVDVDVDVDVVR